MDPCSDLTPLFNWNTKQLFLYIQAEYTNAQGIYNEVVIWDKIVRNKEEANITLAGRNKYIFRNVGKSWKYVQCIYSLLLRPTAPFWFRTSCDVYFSTQSCLSVSVSSSEPFDIVRQDSTHVHLTCILCIAAWMAFSHVSTVLLRFGPSKLLSSNLTIYVPCPSSL